MVEAARTDGWPRPAIAVVAAYGLVLQLWLAAFSGALHAAPTGGPSFCNPAGGLPPVSDRHGPGAPADPCCVFACHPQATGAAPGIAAATIRVPTPVQDVVPREAPSVATVNPRPVGSRAPPIAS